MKYETLFLKIVVIVIGILVLGLYSFLLPWLASEIGDHYPIYITYPTLTILYAAAIPFYYALYQTIKLLGYIEKNKAFSELSIKALKNIKHSTIIICILYLISLPFLYIMADIDDAPGILAMGLVIASISIVSAVFTSVVKRIFENVRKINLENNQIKE